MGRSDTRSGLREGAPDARQTRSETGKEAPPIDTVKRGDVYWCRLDPIEGSKIGKTRPAVIVSLDSLNGILPTVVVCPLTSKPRPQWRTRLSVTCAGRPVDVCAEQIRTVAKARLITRIDSLPKAKIRALQELLGAMYGP